MLLNEVIYDQNWVYILDSVMPGGDNWQKYKNQEGTCLENCPYVQCKGWGPESALCTESWSECRVNLTNMQIIRHVLKNFSFYNREDIPETQNNLLIVQTLIDFVEETINYGRVTGPGLNKTQIKALQQLRLNQQHFKQKLFDYWGGCSITGLKSPSLLVASHIKPWAACRVSSQRNDVYNGLLLAPHYDSLFDKGFITFDNKGKIKISSCLNESENSILGVHPNIYLRNIDHKHSYYLKYHRNNVYIP